MPLLRQVFQSEDRGHRADRNAGAAVDAFRGINIELCDLFILRLILARVDAIAGTDVDAGGVFCADAGLSDYVSHSNLLCSDNGPRSSGNGSARWNFLIPRPCRGQQATALIVLCEGRILNLGT